MEKNPAGSYGALFVAAKGLSSKTEWKEEEKNNHSYEVLGGTHLSLATKRLHEKYGENPHFAGRMCRIYVGLSDEQAVYLGGMHQHSSMFQHEVTYREEVCQNEMLLLEHLLETLQWHLSSSPEEKLSSKLYLSVTSLQVNNSFS